MTSSREQFEAYGLSQEGGLGPGHLVKGEDGEYLNFAAQCYWDFWQASRAALVVKLPEGGYWAGYDNEHMMESRDVRDAIESAGLRVSP